jgi:N-methylhydantoinase A
MAQTGWHEVQRDAGSALDLRGAFALDLRYVGQSHEISTPLATWQQPAAPSDTGAELLAAAAAQFHTLHEQYSGHAMPDQPIESVALRLKMIGTTWQPAAWAAFAPEQATRPDSTPQPLATVDALLAADQTQPHATALYRRTDLRPGDRLKGPAIVLQLDTTTIIPHEWDATIDTEENMIVHL